MPKSVKLKFTNLSSFIFGLSAGFLIALLTYGETLDSGEVERRRAIKAKVAEMYLNNKLELKFRYLTEHKIDALDIHEE